MNLYPLAEIYLANQKVPLFTTMLNISSLLLQFLQIQTEIHDPSN